MGIKKLNFKIDMFTVMLQQTARYGAEHLDDVTPEEYKSLDEIFEFGDYHMSIILEMLISLKIV